VLDPTPINSLLSAIGYVPEDLRIVHKAVKSIQNKLGLKQKLAALFRCASYPVFDVLLLAKLASTQMPENSSINMSLLVDSIMWGFLSNPLRARFANRG
jgi:hypothetical protein